MNLTCNSAWNPNNSTTGALATATESHRPRADVYDPSLHYVPQRTTEVASSFSTIDFLSALPSTGYTLLRPIPVQLSLVGSDQEWVARFEEANIGMSGDNIDEAKEELAHYILDAIELLSEEEATLIPPLKQSLDMLRSHIRIADADL